MATEGNNPTTKGAAATQVTHPTSASRFDSVGVAYEVRGAVDFINVEMSTFALVDSSAGTSAGRKQRELAVSAEFGPLVMDQSALAHVRYILSRAVDVPLPHVSIPTIKQFLGQGTTLVVIVKPFASKAEASLTQLALNSLDESTAAGEELASKYGSYRVYFADPASYVPGASPVRNSSVSNVSSSNTSELNGTVAPSAHEGTGSRGSLNSTAQTTLIACSSALVLAVLLAVLIYLERRKGSAKSVSGVFNFTSSASTNSTGRNEGVKMEGMIPEGYDSPNLAPYVGPIQPRPTTPGARMPPPHFPGYVDPGEAEGGTRDVLAALTAHARAPTPHYYPGSPVLGARARAGSKGSKLNHVAQRTPSSPPKQSGGPLKRKSSIVGTTFAGGGSESEDEDDDEDGTWETFDPASDAAMGMKVIQAAVELS